uniref:Uncharacterized protein n=1 Tax=Anguilla anguilla TaxID=7936 RepID=A0A0E9SG07_ANGAN
MSVPEGLLAF